MANEISTAGVLLKYKVESTAGTKPTGAYTVIPNIVSTGELNSEPDNLEVTDLSDTVWRRYIPGLKDPGGAITSQRTLPLHSEPLGRALWLPTQRQEHQARQHGSR